MEWPRPRPLPFASPRGPRDGSGRLALRFMRLASLMALGFPSLASATPIFLMQGQSATVDSATNETYVIQGGSLDVRPGAVINNVSASFEPGTRFAMSGGRVDNGVTLSGGSGEISGGDLRGFDNALYLYGGDAVFISRGATSITGGTFTGGDATGQAGSGVVASAGTFNGDLLLSDVAISGGVFKGGTGSGGYYGGDTGYSLLSLGNTTVSGGLFMSPIAVNAAYGGVTTFLGTGLAFNSVDNMLTGVLQNGDEIRAMLYLTGARVTVSGDGTEVTIDAPPTTDPDPPADPPHVPEPTTLAIFGLGAGYLALARRRSRRGR